MSNRLRRFIVFAGAAVGLLTAACTPTKPMPTLAVFPTSEDAAAVAVEGTPPAPTVTSTATLTPTTAPTTVRLATFTPIHSGPTVTPRDAKPTESAAQVRAPNPKNASVTFDLLTSKFESRRVIFIARITPQKEKITALSLQYTYPTTAQTDQWEAQLPLQTLGAQMNAIQYSMSVDNMPVGEDKIAYVWAAVTESGKQIASSEQTFKLTESVTAEHRLDLPIMAAKTAFISEFPERAVFTISVAPKVPIQYARFFYTQNSGIMQFDVAVRVPTKKAGERLTLQFIFNDQMGLQIPWQQFESWWELTDRNGKRWRTESAFNEYADTLFHQWLRTETKHAVLFTYGRTAAEVAALVKATDASYERLAGIFGYQLVYTPHVVVYNRQEDFNSWSPPQLSELFIGMASGIWGGCVVTYYDSINFTGYNIIQHELVHLFQYQSLRRLDAYQWWVEGSATYFETAETEDIQGIVRRIVQQYGTPNLANQLDYYAPDGSSVPWPYYAGSTFFTFLAEKYGPEMFGKVHLAAARDIRFPDAIKMATGKTISELSYEWAEWITTNQVK